MFFELGGGWDRSGDGRVVSFEEGGGVESVYREYNVRHWNIMSYVIWRDSSMWISVHIDEHGLRIRGQ